MATNEFEFEGVRYRAYPYREKAIGWMIEVERVDGKNVKFPTTCGRSFNLHYHYDELTESHLVEEVAQTVQFLRERHERYRRDMSKKNPDEWAKSYWGNHKLTWPGY